jgi:hypothetical protein
MQVELKGEGINCTERVIKIKIEDLLVWQEVSDPFPLLLSLLKFIIYYQDPDKATQATPEALCDESEPAVCIAAILDHLSKQKLQAAMRSDAERARTIKVRPSINFNAHTNRYS